MAEMKATVLQAGRSNYYTAHANMAGESAGHTQFLPSFQQGALSYDFGQAF